jgi:hypothetical protein
VEREHQLIRALDSQKSPDIANFFAKPKSNAGSLLAVAEGPQLVNLNIFGW